MEGEKLYVCYIRRHLQIIYGDVSLRGIFCDKAYAYGST